MVTGAIIGDGPDEQSRLAKPSCLEEKEERPSAPPGLRDRRRLRRHPALGHRVQPRRIPHNQGGTELRKIPKDLYKAKII